MNGYPYGYPTAAPHHESGFIWWFIIILVIAIIVIIVLWYLQVSTTTWLIVIGVMVFIFIIFIMIWYLWPAPVIHPGTTILDQQQYHEHTHYSEYPTTVMTAPPEEPAIEVEAVAQVPEEQPPQRPVAASAVGAKARLQAKMKRMNSNVAAGAAAALPVESATTKMIPGQTYFNPNPIQKFTPLPPTSRQSTVNHSQLGVVQGQLSQTGGGILQTTDFGNHRVAMRGGGPPGYPQSYPPRGGTTVVHYPAQYRPQPGYQYAPGPGIFY